MVSKPTNLAMTEGVTTRLQKEFVQFQKDMEKLDVKVDEKLEKWGEKLHSEILEEVNHALDHVNSEIGALNSFYQG